MKNYFSKLFFLLALLQVNFSYCQIENGMIAHFPFDNNIIDLSSSVITATNNNNCTFVSDRNGTSNNSINFNSTGFVSANTNLLKQPFPISVSCWVKINNMSSTNVLFKTDNIFNNYYGVWINTIPSGQLAISFGGGLGGANSANQRYYLSDLSITAGTWHHIIGIIRDYDDMDIYIDCTKANGSYGGTGSTSVAYSTTGDMRIGGTIGNNSHPSDFYMDGSMDQFVFWNREITQNEITFMCNTNNTLSINEYNKLSETKELVKVYDLMGRETTFKPNTPLILLYSDKSTEKVFNIKH